MTQQEILEYNKRCAEFLGINYTIDTLTLDNYFENYAISLYEFQKDDGKELLECFNFHEDWNCIMEVVEAIENLNRTHHLHHNEIKIFRNHIDVSYNMTTTKRYTFSDDYLEQAISDKRNHFKTKKEAVVQAINQFLIWYEQNK